MWSKIAEQKGEVFDDLIPPALGDSRYIWNLYLEVKKGCDDVTYAALDHFQTVTGTILTPREAELMIEVDLMRRKHG